VLKGIFGHKRGKVAGCWIRQHNEELRNLYASPNIISVSTSIMRWTKHVAHMGQMRRRPRYTWRNNIRMGFREISRVIVDWIRLVQDRDQWRALINTVMIFRIP
jgi:hypothetical protein